MKIDSIEIFDLQYPKSEIPFVIHSQVFRDSRGFFTEVSRQSHLSALGLGAGLFVQDNRSHSLPGVIRGLHAQLAPPQAKLVTCVQGEIFDVIVDIRPESRSFGKHATINLSALNGLSLYVPSGFAHGFCVLGSSPADVHYKVSNEWSASGEVGIRFDDKSLGIQWPVPSPILSEKDQRLPTFSDLANWLTERHALRFSS